jgi:hypothetical protein
MLLIEAIRHLADPIPLPSATHGIQFAREHRNTEKLVAVPGIEPGSQGPGARRWRRKLTPSPPRQRRRLAVRPQGQTASSGIPLHSFRYFPPPRITDSAGLS